ncbi:hypothetical protein [Aquipseudomonas ullengensis]|nr:hypothetical protein [Pseudomonas ullengensis]
MSGHVGLREDARLGHLLARRIARLFAALPALDKPSHKHVPKGR